MISGVVALMLEANPDLGWRVRRLLSSAALHTTHDARHARHTQRVHSTPNASQDVQDILIRTARKNDPTESGWVNNGAGLHVNHKVRFPRRRKRRECRF